MAISAVIYNRYNKNHNNNKSISLQKTRVYERNHVKCIDTEPTFSVKMPNFQPTELKKLCFIKRLMPAAGTRMFCFGVTRCHLRTVQNKLCKVLTLNVP